MPPYFPASDSFYGVNRNAELFCQLASAFIRMLSNKEHRLFAKFCHSVEFPSWPRLGFGVRAIAESGSGPLWMTLEAMTTFFDRIFNIIGVSPGEKMIWSNTRRIVAFVAHIITGRYFAEVNLKAYAMCRNAPISAECEGAITGHSFAPLPTPTSRIRFRYFVPEASRWMSYFRHIKHYALFTYCQIAVK